MSPAHKRILYTTRRGTWSHGTRLRSNINVHLWVPLGKNDVLLVNWKWMKFHASIYIVIYTRLRWKRRYLLFLFFANTVRAKWTVLFLLLFYFLFLVVISWRLPYLINLLGWSSETRSTNFTFSSWWTCVRKKLYLQSWRLCLSVFFVEFLLRILINSLFVIRILSSIFKSVNKRREKITIYLSPTNNLVWT